LPVDLGRGLRSTAARYLHDEYILAPTEANDTAVCFDRDSQSPGLSEEGFKYRRGSIRIWKELAVLFLVQLYAERLEERGRAIRRKCTEHVPHDARGAAPEVALGHDAIGDVTTRSAAHQDLRSDLRRTVEASHFQLGRRALREYGGREPCSTGADDDCSHVRR
jgi:hypothetical protein